MKITMMKQRIDSDGLKENLSSKFFLLLIKKTKQKTLPFFWKIIVRLLVVFSTDAGPQWTWPDAMF